MSTSLPPSSRQGFTMIELIVVIGIIIVIFGGGISAYLRLDRRQSLINVCRELEQLARSAQKKARVGERPAGCTRLNAYRLARTSTAPDVITLSAVCDSGQVTVSSYEVPTLYTVESIPTVNFRVLHGGLDGSNALIQVASTGPNYRCSFTIENGGSMTNTTVVMY